MIDVQNVKVLMASDKNAKIRRYKVLISKNATLQIKSLIFQTSFLVMIEVPYLG